MYQLIKYNDPIPSCNIHKLKFVNNKWQYFYMLQTPFKLTNKNEQVLIVYEYISDLHLALPDIVHPESVNLKILTMKEYKKLLETQRLEDIKYRDSWTKNNPDAKPNEIKLENKNYSYKDLLEKGIHNISFIIEQNETETIFAGI